ncbi:MULTISPECIES: 2-succinyl-6-hydroxy-2,4-cyclohexadiene-1-carboxylate synthase [Trichocoleus]|uniref:Putative 2-succinyl-6-hydroxy-2,4-cyclohexadiene-1-carboxylate synthase n=1 Tax=Trichocoleus desertorum GB2-A4 TaxID=2933944 RepID=A0ABV0JCD6_9CYAN|nr:2-succinyl-6-hydroxy-2,4-cyclohexadiene-1-carboxylate synthase [Trichocoleus sp. FACHB-46]MBD1864084.1 2-succinyl-6-hydroxy-2,4-cyclohexadiene-1-carboxylate synthase [Trichocoleus sp. FACHB-46]
MAGKTTLGNYHWHYSLQGDPSQPLVLFLHGFLGDCHDFDSVISLLANQFCCLAVDLPGHGKTKVRGGNEPYAMPQTAQGLVQLLEQLEISPCSLVGYSMGGRLALYLALNFPQFFHRVGLESASPGLKTAAERSQRRDHDARLAEQLETENFSDFLRRWYDQPLFTSLKQHPDFEQIVERRLDNHPQELAQSLRYLSTGRQPSLWERLPENQLPLLLLVGEQDTKFRAINTEMANLCPKTTLSILPNCGHNIHWENPHRFAQQLRQFLAIAPDASKDTQRQNLCNINI